MAKRTIYGWSEQNEACYGLEARVIDWDEEDDLTVNPDGSIDGLYLDGQWFTTFSAAKRAVLKYWHREIATAR